MGSDGFAARYTALGGQKTMNISVFHLPIPPTLPFYPYLSCFKRKILEDGAMVSLFPKDHRPHIPFGVFWRIRKGGTQPFMALLDMGAQVTIILGPVGRRDVQIQLWV